MPAYLALGALLAALFFGSLIPLSLKTAFILVRIYYSLVYIYEVI